MSGIQWSKGSEADSLVLKVLMTTKFVVHVIIYEKCMGVIVDV